MPILRKKELNYSVSYRIGFQKLTYFCESGILAIQLFYKIPPDLKDTKTSFTISDSKEAYTKTLGVEWYSIMDHFRLSVANHSPVEDLTERALFSDIAKTYSVTH